MIPICGSLAFCSPSCCSGRLEWNGADCSLVVQELFSMFGIPLQGAFNREDLTPCPPREGSCTRVTKEAGSSASYLQPLFINTLKTKAKYNIYDNRPQKSIASELKLD